MTPPPPNAHPPIDADQLDRYFAGEASPSEAQLIAARLEHDPHWRRAAETLGTLRFSDAGQSGAHSGVHTDDALARLHTRLAQLKASSAQVAALPANSEAPRYQSGVFPRWSRRSLIASVAGAIVVALGLAVGVELTRSFNGHANDVASSNEYTVRTGERATITLVDGTRVTLGPQSRLRYLPTFNRQERVVQLEGMGFFEVVHDPRRPFTVRTGTAVVQELGTSFSVNSYADDSVVRVVVADGRVVVRSPSAPPSSGTTLVRGDVGTIDPGGLAAVNRPGDVSDALAWTTGRLVFNDMPLRDVARMVSRWYAVDIVLKSPSLERRRVTAAFETESIDDVLSQLAEILRIRYSRSDRLVTVME